MIWNRDPIERTTIGSMTPFEEADGFKALAETYNYTHEQMAEKLGKSRSTITEMLSLTAIPEGVRELCRLADIESKSVLLQVVRQSDPAKMIAFLEKLQTEGAPTRQAARKLANDAKAKAKGRPRNFVFKYQPKEKSFSLALQFRKSDVPRDEVIRALERIIKELQSQS